MNNNEFNCLRYFSDRVVLKSKPNVILSNFIANRLTQWVKWNKNSNEFDCPQYFFDSVQTHLWGTCWTDCSRSSEWAYSWKVMKETNIVQYLFDIIAAYVLIYLICSLNYRFKQRFEQWILHHKLKLNVTIQSYQDCHQSQEYQLQSISTLRLSLLSQQLKIRCLLSFSVFLFI